MAKNPPEGMQRVIPYLWYRDAEAALRFLEEAFGFEVRFRLPAADGSLEHAEAALNDAVVMCATAKRERGQASPAEVPASTAGVMVYVDDVDAHHERAKKAGARITAPPQDTTWGDRMYGARDPEGHAWTFATHVRDVPPDDYQPPGA